MTVPILLSLHRFLMPLSYRYLHHYVILLLHLQVDFYQFLSLFFSSSISSFIISLKALHIYRSLLISSYKALLADALTSKTASALLLSPGSTNSFTNVTKRVASFLSNFFIRTLSHYPPIPHKIINFSFGIILLNDSHISFTYRLVAIIT